MERERDQHLGRPSVCPRPSFLTVGTVMIHRNTHPRSKHLGHPNSLSPPVSVIYLGGSLLRVAATSRFTKLLRRERVRSSVSACEEIVKAAGISTVSRQAAESHQYSIHDIDLQTASGCMHDADVGGTSTACARVDACSPRKVTGYTSCFIIRPEYVTQHFARNQTYVHEHPTFAISHVWIVRLSRHRKTLASCASDLLHKNIDGGSCIEIE